MKKGITEKLTEITDPVLMSIIGVADREMAKKLKDRFGKGPVVLGGASVIENPDDIELDDHEGFGGAFNGTFVTYKDDDEEDDGDPVESISYEEMTDEDD